MKNYLKYIKYLNNTQMPFARIIPEKGLHAGNLLQPAICIKAENRNPAKSHAQKKGNRGHGFMFSERTEICNDCYISFVYSKQNLLKINYICLTGSVPSIMV